MNFTDLPDLPDIWWTYIERYKILNVQGDDFSKMGIFARNTLRNPIVFRAKISIFEKPRPLILRILYISIYILQIAGKAVKSVIPTLNLKV